jgi:hypothetical protein
MKKLLFTLVASIPLFSFSQEMPYTLTVLNEDYTELSEAGSVVGGEVWDDPQATLTLGFEFQIMDEVISEIILVGPGGQIVSNIKQDSVHFMAPYLADLMDVGYDSVSISPLLYTTEGNPGSRIFKLEYQNAGFYAEWQESGTFDNRISFQMWLYEGTNVIEYRFGENLVTQGTLVHFAGAPLIGIGSNADTVGEGGWENFWILNGDPLAPQISNLQSQFELPLVLDSEPPAGTVYRFSPLVTKVNENNAPAVSVIYPTLVNSQLSINWDNDKTMASILDISGKMISTHSIQRGINQLDLSALSSGQYIIHIVGDDANIKQRFTKL